MVQKPHTKCIIISPPSLFFILIGFLIVFTGKSRPPFACDPSNKVTKDLSFCRVNLPIKDRVKDLLGRLTLQEKISFLVNNAAAVPRLGIQGYEWWSDALYGVSDVGPGTKFLPTFLGATQFPQVITTASTFNDTLWEEIGQFLQIPMACNDEVVTVLETKRNPAIWKNFDLCLMSDSHEMARCKDCGKFMKAAANSTLKKHTERHCPLTKAKKNETGEGSGTGSSNV